MGGNDCSRGRIHFKRILCRLTSTAPESETANENVKFQALNQTRIQTTEKEIGPMRINVTREFCDIRDTVEDTEKLDKNFSKQREQELNGRMCYRLTGGNVLDG